VAGGTHDATVPQEVPAIRSARRSRWCFAAYADAAASARIASGSGRERDTGRT
jgi:hypothetical protein